MICDALLHVSPDGTYTIITRCQGQASASYHLFEHEFRLCPRCLEAVSGVRWTAAHTRAISLVVSENVRAQFDRPSDG